MGVHLALFLFSDENPGERRTRFVVAFGLLGVEDTVLCPAAARLGLEEWRASVLCAGLFPSLFTSPASFPSSLAPFLSAQMSTGELAVTYAALILHDEKIAITADKLSAILKAANVTVEAYWPALFAKLLATKNIGDLISNVGSGGAFSGSTPSATGCQLWGRATGCQLWGRREGLRLAGFGFFPSPTALPFFLSFFFPCKGAPAAAAPAAAAAAPAAGKKEEAKPKKEEKKVEEEDDVSFFVSYPFHVTPSPSDGGTYKYVLGICRLMRLLSPFPCAPIVPQDMGFSLFD